MKYVNNNSLSTGSFESALYSIALTQYSWATHEYVPRGASLFLSLYHCSVARDYPHKMKASSNLIMGIYLFLPQKERALSK